jgi:hypothetical protein
LKFEAIAPSWNDHGSSNRRNEETSISVLLSNTFLELLHHLVQAEAGCFLAVAREVLNVIGKWPTNAWAGTSR